MWQTVRQFIIVLHLALGDPSIGHALPQNRAVGSGFQSLTSTKENSVISSTKLKMNFSNSYSTGKPQLISTYSSSWDTHLLVKTTMMKPASKSMSEETYDPPVIFKSPTKTVPPYVRGGWSPPISTKSPPGKPPVVRGCQKISAGALCEDEPINYPKDIARKLSKNDQFKLNYSPYFWSPVNEVMTKEAGPDITTRLDANPNLDGKPICAVKEDYKFVKPLQLMDRNDDWRYILQQDSDNYTQVVQVEVCVNPDGRCQSSLASGYECKCVQKFSYRKLVWITEDNRHGVDDFRIPSCCSCRYYMQKEEEGGLRMSSIHSQKSGG